MGFGDTSLQCKIVFILLILCFISDILGFAIPYWYLKEYTLYGINVKTYGGLWDYCTEYSGTKTCFKYETSFLIVSDWFQVVRAFSILAWVFFLAALVFVIIFMFFLSDKKMLYLVAVCLSFVGAFCALIAFAVYAGKAADTFKEYHASFALTIVAFELGMINGILGIIDYFVTAGGK